MSAGGALSVLHVIPAVAPRYGGPSRAVAEMGRALLARGLEVLVATTDADGPGRLPVDLGRPVDLGGLPVLFQPRLAGEGFKYSPALARWLADRVADFDAVHVHAVFSHACLAAARACRRRGIPYLVRPLGTLDPWSLAQKPFRKRLVWRLGARRMLGGAAAVHCTSEAERRGVEARLPGARAVVIPLGVEDALFEPGARARPWTGGEPYVLGLSRLHAKKGTELLVEAFLEATGRGGLDRWRLVLAGDGDPSYVEGLRRLAGRRPGGDRVVWTGWLDGPERAAALRGADLLALPSRQENFALSAAEAMASGVPVLVSDRVDLASAVAESGAGWVAPLDRAPLARALEAALRSPDERQRRGLAGRGLAERRFRWSAVARDLEAVYAAVARDRGGVAARR